MKCEDYQILIEDYFDGGLGHKDDALVKSHVADCAQCASFFEEASREQDVYVRYQRDVEVSPVLWSSIEARIKVDGQAEPAGLLTRLRESVSGLFAAPRLSPAFAAALVLIAIGMTVAVMSLLNSGGREMVAGGNSNTSVATGGESDNGGIAPQQTSPPAPESTAIAGNPKEPSERPDAAENERQTVAKKPATLHAKATPAQLVREAEQKYVAAIAMLSRDVNRQRSELDPTMLARFDASLSEIDQTIKETKRVVRENPGDPIALQYLLAAYSKKVDVLREMSNN